MTTRVVVSCPEGNHCRLSVQRAHLVDNVPRPTLETPYILDQGKQLDTHVYGDVVLIVKEIL